MLSYVFRTKNRELVNLIFAEANLDSHKSSKASDIAIQIIKEVLVTKFDKGQLDELVGLISKGGYHTTLAGELEEKTTDHLKEKMNLTEDLASQVAGLAVSYLINSLGGFMQERKKTNRKGVQELMAGEGKQSVTNKFLSRFRRK